MLDLLTILILRSIRKVKRYVLLMGRIVVISILIMSGIGMVDS